jgi:hypothetical protein
MFSDENFVRISYPPMDAACATHNSLLCFYILVLTAVTMKITGF